MNAQELYDLTGKIFGPITVVSLHHIKQGRRFWNVRCTCGTAFVRPAHEFRNAPPYCEQCEINRLRESGEITPDWLMALGFDETFWSRFWPNIDKNGPIPIHVPHLGNCHLWRAGINSSGRGCISRIRINGKSILIQTHVAAWIIYKRRLVTEGLNVLHHCDTPRCCREDHLFEGTKKINSDDMISKGRARHVQGIEHPCAKLTEDQVREIRRIYSTCGVTYKDLAQTFGCSPSNIRWIVTKSNWSHLD